MLLAGEVGRELAAQLQDSADYNQKATLLQYAPSSKYIHQLHKGPLPESCTSPTLPARCAVHLQLELPRSRC